MPWTTAPDGVTHSPQYQRWSLELQHVLGVHSSINVGYIGYHGIQSKIRVRMRGDSARCRPLCARVRRYCRARTRGLVGFTTIWSGAVSNYNGMLVSFRRKIGRWTPGLFQANYTLGRALDEISNGGLFGFTGDSTIFAQDPKNLRRSYGPAEYDVRHSVNANYVWELPLKAAFSAHGPNSLVTGWQISGTVLFHSAYPYSVFDGFEQGLLQQKNYFGSIYAVPVRRLGKDPSCGRGAAFTVNVRPSAF
jgi:hypothetical protein